jgi:AmmeMemoRadiSam system protein B
MERKIAAFKGAWYPGDGQACEREIIRFLDERTGLPRGDYVGGIVPHAGWVFSGSIACRVIASLAGGLSGDSHGKVDLVVLFGHHMHPGDVPLVMDRGAWETPLGDLAVHQGVAQTLAAACGATPLGPDTFPDENTIELQLPFVKYFFPGAAIVPIGVPPSAHAEKIGILAVEAAAKSGLSLRVIGSTDMTHYGPSYGFAPAGNGRAALDWVKNANDPRAIKAMVEMDVDTILSQGLELHNLCCPGAVVAAVSASRAMGALRGVALDYANSYEKSPGTSFVGYSGVLFERKMSRI